VFTNAKGTTRAFKELMAGGKVRVFNGAVIKRHVDGVLPFWDMCRLAVGSGTTKPKASAKPKAKAKKGKTDLEFSF